MNAKSTLSTCWPIYGPPQRTAFRLLILKWLEALKKSNQLPADVIIRKSFLEESRGERLDRILYSLCHLLLVKKMTQCGKRSF